MGIPIYFAGSWLRREEIRQQAERFKQIPGVEITSHWLTKGSMEGYISMHDREYGEHGYSDEMDRQAAKRDLSDVMRSERLVLQTEPRGNYTTGGRLIENGYALGLLHANNIMGSVAIKMQGIDIIGRRENVFHFLSEAEGVSFYSDWDAYYAQIEFLSQVKYGRRK